MHSGSSLQRLPGPMGGGCDNHPSGCCCQGRCAGSLGEMRRASGVVLAALVGRKWNCAALEHRQSQHKASDDKLCDGRDDGQDGV
ncbi:hypothetical protein NDU88_006863 [Pleurodeles waltl]|uniref:Uncharacterized protein n=1 Tax=Pleurodeles waltl TaxID=8319 RepID=A0AAV7MF52_PLEWA|nr:hypothetical protein NDU88_006863 [Pleurodeles waltl]